MGDIDPRRAWHAGVIEATATRVKPAFRQVTAPITIDQAFIRRSTTSGPVSGTAQAGATVVVAVDGALFRTTAGLDGSWTVQTVASQGDHDIVAWQVTPRGIHAPAHARLRVTAPWLLIGGLWNDDGAWDDAAVWVD